jgi:hypothetical protein
LGTALQVKARPVVVGGVVVHQGEKEKEKRVRSKEVIDNVQE